MKHTARRALALLIALILALPTLALAEEDVSSAPVDGAAQEMAAFDLGDGDEADNGLTFAEDIDGEAPEVTDDSAPEDTDGEEAEAIDKAVEIAGFLSAGGFRAFDEVPEGAFVVDFVCDPEDAVITVYPAFTDENPFAGAIEAADENVWFLFSGAYTYTAEAGELSYKEDFTVADQDMTLRVALADADKPFALAKSGDVVYFYYASEADAISGMTTPDTANATSVTADDTTWSTGWYVVDANVTNNNRITVSGDVHLILMDGATLTAPKGIHVAGSNQLTIYGQTKGNGALTIEQSDDDDYLDSSSIGGNAGQSGGIITINGGTVNATSNGYGAGIGGGSDGGGGVGDGGGGGTITINGGTVNATSNGDGAGIGGGSFGVGGTITINGGIVNATSDGDGAGIGGGYYASGEKITINGGTVNATSIRYGAGIGGGSNSDGGIITIYGGNVTAKSGTGSGLYDPCGAGIGGGDGGEGGTITINGGTVNATGAADGVGIGGSANNGSLTLGQGVRLQTSTDNQSWADTTSSPDTRTRYMKTYLPYSVNLTGGANATASGNKNQTVNQGQAMATVTYTPSEGYCFEAFDAIADHGITASYDATTGNVTVSGTPTADVAIVIPDAVACYAVNLTGGANATPSGGSLTQIGLTGAMTDVIYTPNTGYHFEASDFANLSSNGVTATYDATTGKVTVSGTPTADVAIVIPDAVEDGAKLMVISASFKDKFQLNFYYDLPASVTADDGAYVRFTKGGKTTDVLVKDITPQEGGDYDGLYRFTFPIVAKEGRDTVNAKLYDGNSTAVTTFNSTGETDLTTSGYDYSLMTYLDYMATNSESESMRNLAAAAIDYCTAAQIYFGYNADGLSVSGAVDAVSADSLSGYARELNGTLPEGVSIKMMTLMLEADNSFRLYFNGDDLDSYTYKVDGANATLNTRADGNRYIRKTGIPARLLHKTHTYSVSDGTNTYTVTASVLTYALAAVMNGSGDIVTLCKALYLYNQAAVAQFGDA